MKPRTAILGSSVALALVMALASGRSPTAEVRSATDEHAHTEAAVLAVEDHWLRAEIGGDTAFLDVFLLPDYRSVNQDGSSHSRDMIIAHAAKNQGSAKEAAEVREYFQSHPTEKKVVLIDNIAIVSFYDPKLGVQVGVRSSDVLIYRDGAWHAVYSQHSALSS